MSAINSDNNNYGSVVVSENDSKIPRQRFDIAEPGSSLENPIRASLHCCRKGETDGFKIIVTSMFVFAVGVTIALIITIASEPAPEVHYADVVSSDNSNCSLVGQRVLQQGGNAIDAAISTTLCLSFAEPHITGIGGGGLMLIHSHRKNTSVVIDFRETAPKSARPDRYMGNPKSSQVGRGSIAVPGFIKGLEYAQRKYGSNHFGLNCCTWYDLVNMALHEVKRGIQISEHFWNATTTKIKDLQSLSTIYGNDLINHDRNGPAFFNDIKIYRELIKTMEIIARNGSAAIYQGGLVGQNLVKDLGGHITLEDLEEYQVKETKPNMTKIGTNEIMVSPAPSGGPELIAFLNALEHIKNKMGQDVFENFTDTSEYLKKMATILKNLEGLQLQLGDLPDAKTENLVHYIMNKDNAAKFVSERQSAGSEQDPNYVLGDPVAANVAVMDKKDNYVSVVTSLNTWFGSKVMSTTTGVLLNNAMANFAIPNENEDSSNTSNQMVEGRRPLTSNLVSLIMDTKDICGYRIVTGGASPSSVGQVLAPKLLLKNENLRTSVDAARLDVKNSKVYVEWADSRASFNVDALEKFQKRQGAKLITLPYLSVNVVVKNMDNPFNINDFRSGENDEEQYQTDL